MPIGMIVMHWHERRGVEIIARYPAELQISEKTLMQVYSTHEYDSEPGTVSLTISGLNIASYYSGPEKAYYVMLLLTVDEDPDVYEDGLADIARNLLLKNEESAIKALIPSLFQRLSIYPKLKPEQKLAMIFAEKTKRKILLRLEEEGMISKSELIVWLKDTDMGTFVDIEALLASFVKEGLIKELTVKGAPTATIFLIRNIFISRKPPTVILKECETRGLPASQKEKYLQEAQIFFKSFKPSPEDDLVLVELLIDPPAHEVLELLRQAVVTRDDLEKLKKKGVDDVDGVLKKLWNNKIVCILRDEQGREYFALLSDIVVERYFPSFLINVVRKRYAERSGSNPVLLEHLKMLKETFWEERTQSKRQIEEITA